MLQHGYLVRSSEHLYFSLTVLYLLLVFFHFKNESTDLIYWYTYLSFSTVYIKTHVMLNQLFTRILASYMPALCFRASPYIESWYVTLNENARVGGNA